MQDENVLVHECDRRVARSDANESVRPELSRLIGNPRGKGEQFAQLVDVRFVFAGCRSSPEPVAILTDDAMGRIVAAGNAQNEDMPALNGNGPGF